MAKSILFPFFISFAIQEKKYFGEYTIHQQPCVSGVCNVLSTFQKATAYRYATYILYMQTDYLKENKETVKIV